MPENPGPHPNLANTARSFLEGLGRFAARAVTVTVEHGPEALATMAALRVHEEYHELLEQEWANHPLLDFIRWQTPQAGETMALTLPQAYLPGHTALADLLRAVFSADGTIDSLEDLVVATGLLGWPVDEFRHGLSHVRSRQLDRALAPLTLGLEGLIRESAISQDILTATEADDLRSGSRLVKRVWADAAAYRPYMERWVFGLANVYRHGGDRGGSDSQALHALCGTAIWADHVLGESAALEEIQRRLASEVIVQFGQGRLQLQPDAERRLQRAAEKAEKSESVQQLLAMRQQLLSIREEQRARA